jgi:hypothetical protein
MTKLGLHGAMIGSNCRGKNLDDPSFEPVWAAAAELDAFMMIHPGNVAGADRLRSYYLGNLIGNPLDTTIAGGVSDLRRRAGAAIRSSTSSWCTAAASFPIRARAGCTAGRCGPSRNCISNIRRRRISTASLRHHPALPRRRSNS